jgi:hypothetical protein
MFKPLSSAYSINLSTFMYGCQGLSSITKRDFYRLFIQAWETSFQKETILKSFKCTGIALFDPEVILQRFNIREERLSSSDSTSSVLSASDWRKIQKLLRSIVDDIYKKETQQLSYTVHTLAVRCDLLQHKNQHLKEALINKKKRRKRSKPLLLKKPADYHSGAVF